MHFQPFPSFPPRERELRLLPYIHSAPGVSLAKQPQFFYFLFFPPSFPSSPLPLVWWSDISPWQKGEGFHPPLFCKLCLCYSNPLPYGITVSFLQSHRGHMFYCWATSPSAQSDPWVQIVDFTLFPDKYHITFVSGSLSSGQPLGSETLVLYWSQASLGQWNSEWGT